MSFRFNREETWQTTTVNVLTMKTQEQLETALHLKTEELKKISLRLEEVDAWITARNVFAIDGDTKFMEKLLTEKIDAKERKLQLETQITFLKWVLQ